MPRRSRAQIAIDQEAAAMEAVNARGTEIKRHLRNMTGWGDGQGTLAGGLLLILNRLDAIEAQVAAKVDDAGLLP